VISVIVCREREALVTLYRDGNIREYSYSEVSIDMRPVPSDQAVQSFPPTIRPLKSFMETADNSLSRRMRMHIIQAGLQNKTEPHSSFEGLDSVKYEDAKSSFDYFSGLSSCTRCGEGVLFAEFSKCIIDVSIHHQVQICLESFTGQREHGSWTEKAHGYVCHATLTTRSKTSSVLCAGDGKMARRNTARVMEQFTSGELVKRLRNGANQSLNKDRSGLSRNV